MSAENCLDLTIGGAFPHQEEVQVQSLSWLFFIALVFNYSIFHWICQVSQLSVNPYTINFVIHNKVDEY